jgi:hypothetical protein
MKDFTPYAIGICCASVCTSFSIEDARQRLNIAHPTGLDHGWTLSKDKTFKDGTMMPCACEYAPETHKHYLFNC